MTATETTIEAVEVKPLDLKHMAEEFIVALDWELKTGPRFTGEKIEPGKIRQFTIDMPIGFSFLPVARQMADEIKANTCGREKFMVMPSIEHSETVLSSYSVVDRETWCAARLIAFGGFIRFEVALESR